MWLLDELKKGKNSNDIAVILRDKKVSYKEL